MAVPSNSRNTYDVNYDDQRFAQVESDKNQALTELEETYSGMIGESDKYYQAQIDASKQWADTQTQLQQQQSDFAIEQIEQQKDQSKKDYLKEQSGAYVDWQKQSDQYGVNSEQMAAQGMTKTGFAESTQTSMYNTYQNRVATAREVYNRAVLNYDNAIKDARLQNNAALAEIAFQALQTQLELSLQGFQYKNTLILDRANKKLEVDNMYYNRWHDVLNQINTENSMAEQIRQYNESLAEERRQFNESMAFEREQYEYQKEQAAAKKSGGGGGGGGGDPQPQAQITDDTTNSGDNPETLESILKLGYGPISAGNLNNKVASGEVKEIDINGTTLFVPNNQKPANPLFGDIKKFW